jgi:hypothetical protein
MAWTMWVALASWRSVQTAVAKSLLTSFAEDQHSLGWCNFVVAHMELPWPLVRMHGS